MLQVPKKHKHILDLCCFADKLPLPTSLIREICTTPPVCQALVKADGLSSPSQTASKGLTSGDCEMHREQMEQLVRCMKGQVLGLMVSCRTQASVSV